jgi:16S rRNA U516 pseudouridylate synthase RsuA-like enzyme
VYGLRIQNKKWSRKGLFSKDISSITILKTMILLCSINHRVCIHPGQNPVTASRSKIILLKKMGGIFTVHRLDKDTSGVIVFAKMKTTHNTCRNSFEDRSTQKIYHDW